LIIYWLQMHNLVSHKWWLYLSTYQTSDSVSSMITYSFVQSWDFIAHTYNKLYKYVQNVLLYYIRMRCLRFFKFFFNDRHSATWDMDLQIIQWITFIVYFFQIFILNFGLKIGGCGDNWWLGGWLLRILASDTRG